jgi:hypothetical protein
MVKAETKVETAEKIRHMLQELGWSDEVINDYLANSPDLGAQVPTTPKQQ